MAHRDERKDGSERARRIYAAGMRGANRQLEVSNSTADGDGLAWWRNGSRRARRRSPREEGGGRLCLLTAPMGA